jgi:hypothetical protein
MNEENLQRYGKYTDVNYRGAYEDVEKRIFDPKRGTDVWDSDDIYRQIHTDLTQVPLAHHTYNGYTILTLRDFHPDKITNPDCTVCILDKQFFQKHPRSPKRIHFIKSYCDLYGIGMVQ